MQAHAKELLSDLPQGIKPGLPEPTGNLDPGRVRTAHSRAPQVTLTNEERLREASVLAQMADIENKIAATRELVAGRLVSGADDQDLIQEIARTNIPRWHFPMLNDVERNDAFAGVLQRLVTPGAHVLDIGAGTGLLAMLAARAGAGRVTACESNPLVAEIARQVVQAHGLSDVVTIIPKRSTELRVGHDLDAPVDLIVSEIVDCGLIGEGLLSTVRHARAELLRPGGRLVPESGRLVGALLESQMVAHLNRVGTVAGFDLRLFNRLATQGHFPLRLSTWPHRLLSAGVRLVEFDLYHDPLDDGAVTVEVDASASGQTHGLVIWFELGLGAGFELRNVPEGPGFHWMQAFVPFDEPVTVTDGQRLAVTVRWHRERLTVSHVGPSSSTEVDL